MIKSALTVSLALLLAPLAIADTPEGARIAARTIDYARCFDTALGYFESEAEAHKAMRKLNAAMIADIREMIALELKANSESVMFMNEMMGTEILVGYFLKSFSEVDAKYQAEKQRINEGNNWEWRKTDSEIWNSHGCTAIYSGLGT